MWVIFEGLDKTGKGTLEREFLKATNYKHVVIDRGPIGYMFYDKLAGRSAEQGNIAFLDQVDDLKGSKVGYIVVYCFADIYHIDARLMLNNEAPLLETKPYLGNDFNTLEGLYSSMVREHYEVSKTVHINTNIKTVPQCIDLIVQKIKEVSQNEQQEFK